jgi:hypothetical protein
MNGLAERDHVRIADDVPQRLQVGVTLSIFAHRSDGMHMVTSPLMESLRRGVLAKNCNWENKCQHDEIIRSHLRHPHMSIPYTPKTSARLGNSAPAKTESNRGASSCTLQHEGPSGDTAYPDLEEENLGSGDCLFLLTSHGGKFSGKGRLHMRNRAVSEDSSWRGRLPQCSLWVKPSKVPQIPT